MLAREQPSRHSSADRMNLRDLEYLVAVADHQHFGRAAEACHVSQPTLSTQIKKLERELGVPLLERGTRHALLTDAGRQVVARARAILVEADTIREIARHTRDPESTRLRLGLFPTLGPYLLPHVVPAITQRFPQLELLLVEEKTDELLRRLREGQLDAALLAAPEGDDQLVEELLFDEDFVLAVPHGHDLATATAPVSTKVLDGTEVMLLDDGHCLREQALSVCSSAGAAERQGFRATSLETLRQMVAAGAGVTLFPKLAVTAPSVTPDSVALVEFADPAPHRRIAMYWRKSSPLSPFLHDLADVVRELPAQLPGAVRPAR